MRPGGLYLSGELALTAFFRSNTSQASDPPPSAPATTLFFQVLHAALATRGLQTDVRHIPTLLQNTGAFQEIQSRVFYIPIGEWNEDPRMRDLGRAFQTIQRRFADSVKPLLRQVGHPREYVDALVESFNDELEVTDGLVGAYYVVQAIKS
jgi:hypothetical protein